MKKWIIGLSLVTSLLLGGCSTASEDVDNNGEVTTSSSEGVPTVTLGVMPSTDNVPFIVAKEQGFDKKHGVDIQLETFKSARDRDAAFQAGQVDGINTDLIAFATYLQGGMDVKITSATFGQFDLIAAPGIQSVAELKGQDILILKNQGPEYAVDKILQHAGLDISEVKMVEVPQVPSRVELLQNNQAGAAILPEPFVTMTNVEGMVNLGSTRDADLNPFVICFPSEQITEKGAAIQGMYDAYNDAVAWMKENDSEEITQLFIDKIGFPEALKESIVIPDYPEASQATIADIESAFSWATEKGLLEKAITPEDVLSDVYFN